MTPGVFYMALKDVLLTVERFCMLTPCHEDAYLAYEFLLFLRYHSEQRSGKLDIPGKIDFNDPRTYRFTYGFVKLCVENY